MEYQFNPADSETQIQTFLYACNKMLEGKVAIIVDNSPIVLTIPYIFIEDISIKRISKEKN